MNDAPDPYAQDDEEDKTFNEELETFVDALECLYVFENLSGRLQFRENWPHVAPHIFSADLLHIDEVGSTDKDFKQKLEEEADNNRLVLIDAIVQMQAHHEKEGTLDAQETKEFVEKFGRETSLLIFSAEIVDRFAPEIIQNDTEEETIEKAPTPERTEPRIEIEKPETKPAQQAQQAVKLKRGDLKSWFKTATQIPG